MGVAVPQEIRLSKDKRTLVVSFGDSAYELAAEYLRVESPSAEVKGHGVGQARLVSGKQEVTIGALEPVGNYALKIVFSDGHQTGIFTWDYLQDLGKEYDVRWARYTQDLSAAGLSRDKSGPMVLRASLR